MKPTISMRTSSAVMRGCLSALLALLPLMQSVAAYAANPLSKGPLSALPVPATPLSTSDDNAVNKWIAERVGAKQQSFCYKDSYGRGAGYPLTTCPANQQKNGALCYPDCKAGYGGAGPVCWHECPSGYVDTGAFCHIDKSLTEKPNIHCKHWYEPWTCHNDCNSGYTNAGVFCALTTPRNPPGWSGTGLDLVKSTYGRGAGYPLHCAANLQQDAALCYPSCKGGFYGVGPVCWGSCASGMTDCGAGCSSSKSGCASSVSNMIISPLMVVASVAAIVVTAGAGTGAVAAADEGTEAGVHGAEAGAEGAEAAEGAKEAAAAEKEAGTLDKFAQKIQDAWSDFVKGQGQKVADLKAGDLYSAVTSGNKAIVAAKFGAKGVAVGMMIDTWVKDATSNFASLTTPEVTAQLNKSFAGHPKALNWVEAQYALVNLSELAGQNGQQTANTALGVAGLADPTGVTGVVAAYDNPKCALDDPFPSVRILY